MNFTENHYSKGTPEDEGLTHIKYVSQCNKGCIVEIGVLVGDTSLIFCKNVNPNINVYGIDPIIEDSMNISLKGNEHVILNKTKTYTNYKFIKDYSFNVVKQWTENIEYLFIDGSHIYEDVLQDFNDWFAFVIPGGYIAIHDSSANRKGPYWWEGPSKLADELIFDDRVEYLETVFCLTIFKKK